MDLKPLKSHIKKDGVLAIAKKTGLSRSTIHNFAFFDKSVSLKNLEKLAKAAGFQIDVQPNLSSEKMTSAKVISELVIHRASLKKAGIQHISLFGSVAKDKIHAESDVDLLVVPESMKGLKTIAAIEEALAKVLVGMKLDIVFDSSLKPSFKALIEKELIHVF